jgi:hypothetical protein
MPHDVTATTEDTIDTRSTTWTEMEEDYWRLTRALRSGTDKMRDEGIRFLPRRPREEDKEWEYRRDNSYLYKAYDDAVTKAAEKPFIQPIEVAGDLPPQLAAIEDNADMDGRDLTQLGAEAFDATCDNGMGGLLVDYPRVDGAPTRGEEGEMGLRPAISYIDAQDVIGYTWEKTPAGEKVLTSVRIKETRTERQGEHGDKDREYIRKYTKTAIEVQKKTDEEKWVVVPEESGPLTRAGGQPLGEVPFKPHYFNRKGFMKAEPCFWPVGELNKQHWQRYSIHTDYVDVAQIAGWGVKGVDDTELTSKTFSHRRLMGLGLGELVVIEAQGNAYQVGSDFLEKLEARMRQLANTLMVDQSGDPKATGQAITESKSMARIHKWIRALESALVEAYELAALWIGAALPSDFAIKIFSDFTIGIKSGDDLRALTEDFKLNAISHARYLTERKRRALYAEDMDVQEEVKAAKKQAAEAAAEMAARMAEAAGDEEEDEEEDGPPTNGRPPSASVEPSAVGAR